LRELVHAHAGRLSDRGRHPPRRVVAAGDLQSVVPVPPRAHGDGVVSVDELPRHRGRRVVRAAPAAWRVRADHAALGARRRRAAGTAADLHRRPARAQHLPSPADEGRGDRRPLADLARRAADPVRMAGSGSGEESPRSRDPQSRQRDPHAPVGRRSPRTHRSRAAGSTAGRDRVLGLSRDGRLRTADARARVERRVPAASQAASRHGVAPAHPHARRTARVHRRARGLDHDRMRASAVDRVRIAAHARLGVGGIGRQGRSVAVGICDRLRAAVLRVRALLPSPRAQRPGRRARAEAHEAGRPARIPRHAGSQIMSGSPSLLPSIWMAILCFNITLYVLLDGFSLGVGILFPWARKEDDRSLMMASVAPVWDGNQTWLVGGGAALFTAFPKAFNLLGAVLYLPLMMMLLALVFRGVAFEFRFKARRPELWSLAFTAGSTIAALCQGLVLGTFVQGFRFDGSQLISGPLGFITPFSIATALGVLLA